MSGISEQFLEKRKEALVGVDITTENDLRIFGRDEWMQYAEHEGTFRAPEAPPIGGGFIVLYDLEIVVAAAENREIRLHLGKKFRYFNLVQIPKETEISGIAHVCRNILLEIRFKFGALAVLVIDHISFPDEIFTVRTLLVG